MTEARDSQRELDALRARLTRAERELVQLRRVAATSEEVALQSKRAMLQSNAELQRTVEQLTATTERLEEARQAAEEASEAKTRFLATISHEIRTPLNGVIGSIELLRLSDLDEDQRQLTRLMSGSGQALLALINDVLDAAKIEAGKVALERIPFSLMGCLEGVVGQELANAGARGIDLLLDYRGDLPDRVLGDPTRVRQVLANLVSNAVKFTAEGEVRVVVKLREAGGLRFEVRDTGIGIDPAALEHLFVPFQQADEGTTRLYGGTGLGLSICAGLAALMGGEVLVESEPGVGSCFTFDCPDLVPETEEPERAAHPRAPFPADLPRIEKTVLVVDDMPTNRILAGKMLERLGATVTYAENGRDAVEQQAANPADIVLMDCSMPVMDGYEATRAIRELPAPASTATIVALTAYAVSGDREACLAAGMDDYLAKPFRLEELATLLDTVPHTS